MPYLLDYIDTENGRTVLKTDKYPTVEDALEEFAQLNYDGMRPMMVRGLNTRIIYHAPSMGIYSSKMVDVVKNKWGGK